MPRKKTRRQAHGSAWHWKQTDCWYYTPPGSKGRQPLFDEHGQRIRGLDNREAAQRALARLKLAGDDAPPPPPPEPPSEWLVARVCSEYLQYCQRGVEHGRLSRGHTAFASWVLNDLCKFCGALPVAQLQKKHVEDWVASHTGWESPVTRRSALSVVLTAFHYAQDSCGVPSPRRGLKNPPPRPRLHSFSPEDEKLLYQAAAGPFGDFLFAALHTGLRPYCELARLKAEDVSQTERGMLWRVYSSKTKKTRKIPVRPEVAELTRRLLKEAPPGHGVDHVQHWPLAAL